MKLYKPYILDHQSLEIFYKYAENFVIDNMLDSVAENGSFRLGLAGGSTPIPLYKMLGKNPTFEARNVEIYQLDERVVSSKDPHSNQKNISEAFGDYVMQEFKEVRFFDVDNKKGVELSKSYEEVIDTLQDPIFDLSILGVGKDGHIASLFPGGNYYNHNNQKAFLTKAPIEFDIENRVSISIESILNSKTLLLLITGEDKAEVLREMLEGKESATKFPAKFLLAHPSFYIYTYFKG